MTFLLWRIPFCSSSEFTSVGFFVLDLMGEKPNGRVMIGRMESRAYGKQFKMPGVLEGMILAPVEAERNSKDATWESYKRLWSIEGGKR